MKNRPSQRTPRMLVALVFGLTCLAGCAPVYTDFSAFLKDPEPLVSSREYLIEPPDAIRIVSKRVREVNGHTERLRPDGKITLPLIGPVFITGKTPEQASADIQTLAREYYADADISLRVVAFNSKKIFVWGEVAAPGPYAYTGKNRIMQTLARSQPTRLADPAKIAVLRPNKDGKLVKRMTIDLNKMIKEGDTGLDAPLEHGDIIYVPPNPLAAVGLALQQLLLPIQPAAATVQGPTDIHSDLQNKPFGDGDSQPSF